jgi:DHA1 family bicyclomycin/chloramphenicol resistance-like MFS transporter
MSGPDIRLPGPPLWLLVSLAYTGTLAMHMFVPALSFAADDLGIGSAQVQLSLTVYILGLAVGQLIYGPISDAVGRRPVVVVGILVFAAGSLACALAQNLPALLAGRLLQALGGAGGLTLARAIVRDMAGAGGSQKDISLLNLVMLVGPAVSAVIGSGVAVHAGWRAIFVLLGLMAVLVLAAVIPLLPETARNRKPLRLEQLARDFRTLLGHRRFVCIALGGALGSTSTYGYFAAAPYILQDQLGVAPGNVGYYVGGILVGALGGTYASRYLVGRIRQNTFLLLSSLLAIAAAAAFLASALGGWMSATLVFALTFAMMFAAGCISVTALAASLDTVPSLAGSAAGFFGSAQMAVGGLCTFLVGFGDRHDVSCGVVMLCAAGATFVLLHAGRLRA